MTKENFENKSDQDLINLETTKFEPQSYTEAMESGIPHDWFEEMLITKSAKLELGRDSFGHESALVKAIDPESKKEVQYYTIDPGEVERLKAAKAGRPITVDESPLQVSDDELEDEF
jgi:hypothetical protein